jgi:signal transduction histidine kinase
LLVLAVLSLGAILVSRFVASQDALADAERSTGKVAELVISPLLGEALAGNAERRAELDRAIRARLSDGSISEINVWRGDGTILYADKAQVIGKRVDPPQRALDVIERGTVSSDIAFADESGDLPAGQEFVEVYVPLRIAGQPPLAFEAYYDARPVTEQADALGVQLVALALVPLVLLQLVQLPIAVSLAKRVGHQEAERTRLLERALSASDRERAAIAAGLHDNVVQQLAGASYALASLAKSVPPGRRAGAENIIAAVRSSVDTLRGLMIEIYPPDLTGPGLPEAIDALAAPLRAGGVTVSLEVTALPTIEPDIAATVYRVARETLVNVGKHAMAHTVRIELGPAESGSASPAVQLRVIDDGIGLATDAMERRSDGHLGLHMLHDRVADLGGRFTVATTNGSGTVAEAVLPLRRPD